MSTLTRASDVPRCQAVEQDRIHKIVWHLAVLEGGAQHAPQPTNTVRPHLEVRRPNRTRLPQQSLSMLLSIHSQDNSAKEEAKSGNHQDITKPTHRWEDYTHSVNPQSEDEEHYPKITFSFWHRFGPEE